jgi:EpsD family peptidyl-prolyl cis-trans isomerase
VATVDGEPITTADLQIEQGALRPGAAAAGADVDRAALQRIIDRKLLAKAAVAQKLDQTSTYALEARRAREAAQATALARTLATARPEPTNEEIAKFIADNPQSFADHKLIIIDQIRTRAPSQPLKDTANRELDTLEAVQATLDQTHVPYQRSVNIIDSGQSDPAVLARLSSIAPHTVFEVVNGDMLTINQVQDVHPAPVTGSAATELATTALRSRNAESALRGRVEALRAAAKTKITYSPGYEPAATSAP